MSYIRFNWGLKYVADRSHDYVICSSDDKGTKEYIISYGYPRLHKTTMAEFFLKMAEEKYSKTDPVFYEFLRKCVSNHFKVKLRKKPLTFENSEKILSRKLKEDFDAELIDNKKNVNVYNLAAQTRALKLLKKLSMGGKRGV